METTGEEHSPFFRALSSSGRRYGLKLERVYWDVLKRISDEEHIPLGDIVSSIAGSPDEKNFNLTAKVRSFAISWLERDVRNFRDRNSMANVRAMVAACPSPVFVLSTARQVRAHNPAFIGYIRANMPAAEVDKVDNRLRLQLDMNMDELVERLKLANQSPLSLGFALGLNDRRVRGRLNAVLAPCWVEDLVVGYIVS
ncbi:ribbon-helix-helix domain-containing protein [Oricola cellulosilytica]|nr:ribbon-helix-helix domain-containing protein [Oricola cellulosilytica]